MVSKEGWVKVGENLRNAIGRILDDPELQMTGFEIELMLKTGMEVVHIIVSREGMWESVIEPALKASGAVKEEFEEEEETQRP